MSKIAILRKMLVPRVRAKRWDDAEDDPMSKREGKYFNMGVDAAADELDLAFKELEGLVEKETGIEIPETFEADPMDLFTDPQEEGWLPVAITEECLKPAPDSLLVVVAYKKEEFGKKVQYKTSMQNFTPNELKKYIKEHDLEILTEKLFNKKYEN